MVERGGLGKIPVAPAEEFDEFIGLVVDVKRELQPDYPDKESGVEQYHLLLKPDKIKVKGKTGCLHEWVRITKKEQEDGIIREGSSIYRYIQEIQSVLPETKDAETPDDVFKILIAKHFLFKRKVLGSSFRGHPPRRYWVPIKLLGGDENE